jgi:hypothetical protein
VRRSDPVAIRSKADMARTPHKRIPALHVRIRSILPRHCIEVGSSAQDDSKRGKSQRGDVHRRYRPVCLIDIDRLHDQRSGEENQCNENADLRQPSTSH